MKKTIFSIICLWGTIVHCEEKPLMPPQSYMFYRRAKESKEGTSSDSPQLKQYRLPTEEEKRAYLYSNYLPDFKKSGGRGDAVTLLDIRQLCSWLIEDAPKENIPYVIEFASERTKELEKIKEEYLLLVKEKESVVREAILSLADLGVDAMPYYIEFLESDSKVVYEGACSGISVLFKNKDISERTKQRWVNDLIKVIWTPSTPSRDSLIQRLLHLDAQGHAPMDIKDWVSICFAEKDIGVFEQVYSMYPKEFREWQGKKGGFRKLIDE